MSKPSPLATDGTSLNRRAVLGVGAAAVAMTGASEAPPRARIVYRLPRTAGFQRIIGWDLSPDGTRLVVAGPEGSQVMVVDVADGSTHPLHEAPFVGNPDPRVSLLKFADDRRVCWPATSGGGAWDLVLAELGKGLTRLPLGVGRPRDLVIAAGNAFVLMQDGHVSVASLDGGPVQHLSVEEAIGLSVNADKQVFALETTRSADAIAMHDIAREEASRTFRLRPLSSPGGEPVPLEAHGGGGSLVGALPGGGWALLSEPVQLANPHAAARLTLTDAGGRARQTLPIAPPTVLPAAVTADAQSVYVAFMASDQPVQRLALGERVTSSFNVPGGAVRLIIRNGRLFFGNTDRIGYIG